MPPKLSLANTVHYDLAVNTTSLTDASGNVSRYAYGLAGNKLRKTDRLGHVTSYLYDAADRLVEERWQRSKNRKRTRIILDGRPLGSTKTGILPPCGPAQ